MSHTALRMHSPVCDFSPNCTVPSKPSFLALAAHCGMALSSVNLPQVSDRPLVEGVLYLFISASVYFVIFSLYLSLSLIL